MIVIIGTLLLLLCILLSRKALNDILLKIKDGENLLLVIPENIKNKYIEQMKTNKIEEIILIQQQHKAKQNKLKSKKSNDFPIPSQEPE